MPDPEPGLEEALVRFGRLLRDKGIQVGPDQAIRYRRAIARLDRADLADLYWAGRACLLSDRAAVPAYDRAFAEHFLGRVEPDAPPARSPGTDAGPSPDDGASPPAGRAVERERLLPRADGDEGGDRLERSPVGEVASAFELLRDKSFPAMTDEEQATLARLLRDLRPNLPTRRTRRTRPADRGVRLDLRRSVRRSLRTQGELVNRHWRHRRIKRRALVLVLDVSGSMADYSRFLLLFAYGLARAGAPVEVFCFGTRLTRITPALRTSDPDVALRQAAAAVVDWDGGTRIGESLREFARRWGRQGYIRGSLVLICSDGLERGDPALLGQQMARLSRLVHRVIWVNPLKGDPEFRPVSRGMRAALPYVDELVAGDTLGSLAGLAARLDWIDQTTARGRVR
jgi:uncharacterized protein with von Willebrand factor type A (vWA) domain